MIIGETPVSERQAAVRRFQADDRWYGDGCRKHLFHLCIQRLGMGVDDSPASLLFPRRFSFFFG